MRKNSVGMSGSSIYSDANKFHELYLDVIEYIEIGQFSSEQDFNKFLEINSQKNIPFGIHSPLFRTGSKYDLLERVEFDPSYAWEQLEEESKKLSKLGTKYLLVHFPYFKGEEQGDTNFIIEEGLKKLKYIQDMYKIDIICEPKLGMNRCASGINYLQKFPIEIWRKYNIGLCIDIGDYIIAVEDNTIDYLNKWKEFIRVAHLHNIYYEGERYIWIPVHPSQELDKTSHKVKGIIEFLASCGNIIFVFEHTPETNPHKQFVVDGITWTRDIIK